MLWPIGCGYDEGQYTFDMKGLNSMEYLGTKVDWNAFQYMFSQDPRTAFQQLSEQLFCFEFKQPYGIYRYYNQPYIETIPIYYSDKYVSFQSKYYDAQTKLASKKGELISAITGAHQKYPSIDEIIFYVNKEPGISTVKGKTKPAYIEEIERHGEALGIHITWRGLNQMETMLLRPELEHIRDYFFATNGGIRKILGQLMLHKKSIFDSISFDIFYEGRTLKIARDNIDFDNFMNSNHNILLVYGDGGCGKSGLIKERLEGENRFPIWLFRVTDFDFPSIPEFTHKFGDYTWDDLLSAFDNAPKKICIIDSAEKAFTIEYQETFKEAVRVLLQHGWQMVITIRTVYKNSFLNTILQTTDVAEHEVKKLSEEEMSTLEENYSIKLPLDHKLRDFLSNLFYLKLYLSGSNVLTSNSVIEFRDNIWNEVICASSQQKKSLHLRRGQAICKLVRTNANNGTSYYVPCAEDDWDALSSLSDGDIIHYDDAMGGFFVTHDVYEEIVLKHILSQTYQQEQSTGYFYQAIGDSLVMRKAFRFWLHDQFEDRPDEIKDFLSDSLTQKDINTISKDEILISLMEGNNIEYFPFLDGVLQDQKYQLFIRALALLNTACRTVNTQLWQKILTEEEIQNQNIYRWTKPAGSGWNYLISYAYTQREDIPWSPVVIMLTVDVLYTWTNHIQDGATIRNAGLMALYLYRLVKESKEFYYQLRDEKIGRICDAILNSAKEILPELKPIFESVIAKHATDHQELYNNLCKHLLSNVTNCGAMCAAAPELVFRLAKTFWLKQESAEKRWGLSSSVSEHFGLNDHMEHMYYPESAFQTPIFSLLQTEALKTMDFIVDLFNTVTEVYKNSVLNAKYKECTEIKIIFPNGDSIVQTASERLWNMYRGTSVAPDLLKSILMALERWLYFAIPNVSVKVANSFCVRLLSRSQSVAITAVVVSMATAYPDKLFQIACILLHTKEIFSFDITRFASEYSANFFKGMNPHNRLYDDERINSNKLPFRKRKLEDIILKYQLGDGSLTEKEFEQRRKKLYQVIDESFQPEELLTESEQFALYRMDLRKMKLVQEKTENGEQVALVSDLPNNLIQIQQDRREITRNNDVYLQLFLWSHSRFDKKSDDFLKYTKYEMEPEIALQDAWSIVEERSPLSDDISILIYVSAVLLIDFVSQISEEIVQNCTEIVIQYLLQVIDKQDVCSAGDGTDAAVAALPAMITHKSIQSLPIEPAYLLLMLICDWGKQRDWAVSCFREHIWKIDRALAQKIILSFICLKPEYDKKVSKYGGMTPHQFFDSQASLIDSIMQDGPKDFPPFTNLSNTALQTLCLLFPIDDALTEPILLETGKLFWKDIFEDHQVYHEERIFRDREQERAYLGWLSDYLLHSPKDSQRNIIITLTQYLRVSDMTNSLLTSIIMCQDQLQVPISFWNIWDQLFDFIEKICSMEKDKILHSQKRSFERYYAGELGEILVTYLLAFPRWNEKVHSWHTLCIENCSFFTKVANRLGYHPGTLYAIARVLNTIGYNYLDQGISWLATIIHNNPHLLNCSLEVNTEYYIEECLQRYVASNRIKIKRNPKVRRNVLDTLSFLVSRGSTCAFMLRENIC